MHRLMSLAASMTWAISPSWLTQILAIANREGPGPEAVARELGRPLDNTRSVTNRDGVAVIPVTGPIFRRANAFSEISGATSVQVLATDLHLALDSEDVSAIVLEVDSPGGEVAGISELADMIYAARGRKPIVAYVDGTCASAAYWLASACDEIVATDTAVIGSIGVVRAVPNPGATRSADIEIVSNVSPNKRPNVRTEEGRAVYQAEVDALADVFVSRVARNRGVSVDAVLADFGQGGCLIGAGAVAAGMVDAVGSLESVIASHSSSRSQPTGAQAVSVTRPASPRMESPIMAKIRPALAAAEENKPADAEDEAPPASEPDGDEPAAPVFEVGDEVMFGDQPAKVTEVRNGPHYALELDSGEAVQWASEDELAGGEGSPDDAAEEEEDESPKARALAVENKRLRALLAGSKKAAKTSGADALIAEAKASKKITPALEQEIRKVAAMSLPVAKALVSAMPKIAPLASVARPPARRVRPLDLTFAGKSYADLSLGEKHELATTDKELFDAMRVAHEAAQKSGG